MNGGGPAAAGWLPWALLLLSGGCATDAVRHRLRRRRGRRRARLLLSPAAPSGQPAERLGETRAGAVRRALSGRLARAGAGGAGVVRKETAAVVGVAVCGPLLLGGVTGLLAGALGAYGVRRWLRRHSAGRPGSGHPSVDPDAVAAKLPLTAELLAACLAAGSGPGRAAEEVGRCTGGPLGRRLSLVACEIRLGADPALVWERFAALPGCARLARCMERAGTAGVPAAAPMTRLAAELRAEAAREATARARRVAVVVTAPLGACFLPAFLAVGVAPVVLGLTRSLL